VPSELGESLSVYSDSFSKKYKKSGITKYKKGCMGNPIFYGMLGEACLARMIGWDIDLEVRERGNFTDFLIEKGSQRKKIDAKIQMRDYVNKDGELCHFTKSEDKGGASGLNSDVYVYMTLINKQEVENGEERDWVVRFEGYVTKKDYFRLGYKVKGRMTGSTHYNQEIKREDLQKKIRKFVTYLRQWNQIFD